MQFKTITEKEAKERFQLAKYIHTLYSDDDNYVLMEGDIKGDGSVDLYQFCSSLNAIGIIVDGNLTITGTLSQLDEEYGETLFVTGNLHVKNLIKGGAEFYIKGNLVAEQTLYGFYNDGRLTVEGNIEADTIFAEDQHFIVGGNVKGLLIDTGKVDGAEADFFTTEPLLNELILNEKHCNEELLLQYIQEGRPIIKEQYRVKRSLLAGIVDNNISAKPILLTYEEAQQRLDLTRYDLFQDIDVQKLIFLDGDTYIKGDLNQQWSEATLEALGADTDLEDTLILVNGNLTVAGTIKPSDENCPHLLVIGNVQCDVLQSYDEFIHITGNADITWALDGNYNQGSIAIEGITRVPYVLNHEHHCAINPEGAILINYYNDRDNKYFIYDYTVKDLERILVPAVFDEHLNPFAFIELLKAGKSPLKKGVRPANIILLEELQQMSNGNADIQELDLSEKRLKEFPSAITKITSLKKLVLNDNAIGSIPAAIKDLVNLEELHLQNCDLTTLPAEIGLLPNLQVLYVSYNKKLQLPESINQLSLLRVLNISYNTGFGLPASLSGLKNLEELACNNCCTDVPGDFPEAITQLSGLKWLFMCYNSLKAIPESILNLHNLEELGLDASLGYLNELPDLSKLKKLKTIHAHGLVAHFAYPVARQSLLQSFFTITHLEALYIDRHGKREEVFINKNELAKIEQALAHAPERFREFTDRLVDQPNEYWGTGKKGIVREALKAEHLKGISNLQQLKVLDLSFNDLSSLPEEILTLKNLQFLDLQYNRLPFSERLAIAKALPGCTIDYRSNGAENETADTEEEKQWQAMNKLIKEANALMYAHDDREKLLNSLIKYDEVLAFFNSGKVVDEYNLLYANYGKVYAYNYLTSTHKAGFSAAELSELINAAIKQASHTLSLVPAIIWHYTDLGKFHEEITRITANSLAWLMYTISDTKEELEKALEIILKGVAYIENGTQYFIYDTQVRILLKLGRTNEAYQIVKRTLAQLPDFGDFQDIKTNDDYKEWLKKQ